FQPKEHIAGNAPMKSSAQRQIRAKLVDQIPFLSHPASPAPAAAPADAPEPAPQTPAAEAADDDDEDDGGRAGGKKGKGGKKGGKGGGAQKGGKKGRRGDDHDDDDEGAAAAEDSGALTVLDLIWPKKETLSLVKCRDHISIYTVHGEPIFYQHFDGPFYPTLRLLHRFPDMLPRVGVDRGAIKFVLSGANIMCPGMTSATGYLPPSSHNIPKGTPVAVHAYGKENALAIGLLTMSTDEIRSVNKNIGVENIAFLGDDLWKVDRL
ncbi:translation machinery-associated protein 20, partial [Rhodotorula paludigena]|uniref:translation machinery-associated protein 20 n=1 Tax=Rhodotorula paludigena TaxID=86838 RepID=UPI003174A976